VVSDVVELRGVTKRFPGVVALQGMDLRVAPGQVHGLIGENGAGKSTLIKVLTGVHTPDEGELLVGGEPATFGGPMDARAAGIACVYQELNIVGQVSLTDNIFMNQPIRRRSGLLDYPAMHARATELMQRLGQRVDVTRPASRFGMGVLQMVEIARALLQDARLIIMDEPTSSLGEHEVSELFDVVRRLKDDGVAVVFVSHKLEELFELCDVVTVMRDGTHVLTADVADLTTDTLVSAMIGRSLDARFPDREHRQGPEAVRFEHVTSAGELHDVSFTAYAGEICGFAGLVGSGRTETMRTLFGDLPVDSGTIHLHGQAVHIRSPRDAVRRGIAFLTEDRKGQGLVLDQSIGTNLMLGSFGRFTRAGFLDRGRAAQAFTRTMERLRIKAPSAQTPARQLSGGNQQKVVIGKWLNSDAQVYLFDEPTRGIDVGAKAEVYAVMAQLAAEGKCIIMVSSELPEILGMSDRVVVMSEGKVMARIARDEPGFDEETIMQAAWGERMTDDEG